MQWLSGGSEAKGNEPEKLQLRESTAFHAGGVYRSLQLLLIWRREDALPDSRRLVGVESGAAVGREASRQLILRLRRPA